MIPVQGFSNILRALALTAALLCLPSTLLADARSDGERGIAEYRKGNLIAAMESDRRTAIARFAERTSACAENKVEVKLIG